MPDFIAVCLPKSILPEQYKNCDSLALKPESLEILEDLERDYKDSMTFEFVTANTKELAWLVVKYRKPLLCAIHLSLEIKLSSL